MLWQSRVGEQKSYQGIDIPRSPASQFGPKTD